MVLNCGVVCFMRSRQISWGFAWLSWKKVVLALLAFLQKQCVAMGSISSWCVWCPGSLAISTRRGQSGGACVQRAGWLHAGVIRDVLHEAVPLTKVREQDVEQEVFSCISSSSLQNLAGNLCFYPSSLYSSWIRWSFLALGLKIIPGGNLFLI